MQQMLKQQNPIPPQPKLYGQIPIHRVDNDARELTQIELDRYKHLIPRENQRQQIYNNQRREGMLSRVRTPTRTRNTSNNVEPQSTENNFIRRNNNIINRHSIPSTSSNSSKIEPLLFYFSAIQFYQLQATQKNLDDRNLTIIDSETVL